MYHRWGKVTSANPVSLSNRLNWYNLSLHRRALVLVVWWRLIHHIPIQSHHILATHPCWSSLASLCLTQILWGRILYEGLLLLLIKIYQLYCFAEPLWDNSRVYWVWKNHYGDCNKQTCSSLSLILGDQPSTVFYNSLLRGRLRGA